MKLSEWAKEKGITYKTAYRMFRAGKLPVASEQLPTGTILVYPEQPDKKNQAVLYARVSSHDHKKDLKRQINRLRDYAAKYGYNVIREVCEIGSGLKDVRKELGEILSDANIKIIIVEHRDRLARFGTEMLVDALSASGRKIVIINQTEYKDDIIQDFSDLITSMCVRIYGKRAAENKARKMMEAIEKEGK
ncbi:IS607 family transposase [Desulfobacterales bacterium HSG2]|nr:IS607 family transposase [Desulfobacterales bacterium HSG2]